MLQLIFHSDFDDLVISWNKCWKKNKSLTATRGWKKFETFIASTFGIEPSSSTDTNNWITAIKTKLESLSLSLESENESEKPLSLHRP